MQTLSLSDIISEVKTHKFFIVDKKILQHYKKLTEVLADKIVYIIEEPESAKNMQLVSTACDYFLESHITRKDTLVVIGGGASSDFGGFVAAILLRGIKWRVFPTTLLSMVDAAIGGKVGVNSKWGKNLMGSFHLPEQVSICSEFLSTLPSEELQSGTGEVIKYCFLSHEIYQLFSEKGLNDNLIQLCAEYKTALVARDFKEQGERKILNLGHTFGHAIEKELGIPHGYAVLIGIQLIIDIYSPALKQDFHHLLTKLNINIDIPRVNFEKFWNYLLNDKKIKDNKIELIIPKKIGKIEIITSELTQLKTQLKNYENFETYFE